MSDETNADATPDTLRQVGEQRERLATAAAEFEAVLARAATEVSDWKRRAQAAAVELEDALVAHVDEVEAPDGLYAEIMARAPRLARQIHRLRVDHDHLRWLLWELEPLLAEHPDAAQIALIRERGLDLLSDISRHRHRGADLIWDAYDIDIGSVD